MSHTLTQKVTIFTFVLAVLFVLSLVLPTEADAKTRAERIREREARIASSTRPHNNHASSTRPERTASSTDSLGWNVDATCMQAAVDTREASVASAFTNFTATMTSVLSARKTALYAAWGMSDISARHTALKTAWRTARDAAKSAHATLKSDRKTAWEAFKTTAKNSCRTNVPREESLDRDVSGSISL